MPTLIDIPEGRTNDYLIHGVFVVIGGGILLLVHWSLTLIALALAVALFRISSGVEIDAEGKRARVYKALGGLRMGMWRRPASCTGITIRYTNESQVMSSRASSTNVRTRTYDVHFMAANGTSYLFHDFTDYAKARKCAVTMAKSWSLPVTDEVEDRRHRAQANAGMRRR